MARLAFTKPEDVNQLCPAKMSGCSSHPSGRPDGCDVKVGIAVPGICLDKLSVAYSDPQHNSNTQ